MNDSPKPDGQNEDDEHMWVSRIEQTARHFDYPPTPDIAAGVRPRIGAQRRWALSPQLARTLIVLFLALAGLMAVPEIRAAIFDVIRLGAIGIFQIEQTPTLPDTPEFGFDPFATPLASVLDLAGETTLIEARAAVNFEIRLPAYPPDLGLPDRVFVIKGEQVSVVLVWIDPAHPDAIPLSLHLLSGGSIASKYYPGEQEEALVNGQPALWLTAPHLYLYMARDGDMIERYVGSSVLIWEEAGVTYRIEGASSLDEAVRMAESLE